MFVDSESFSTFSKTERESSIFEIEGIKQINLTSVASAGFWPVAASHLLIASLQEVGIKFKCIKESLGLYRKHSRNDSTPKWNHIKELQSMYKELQKGQILKKRSDIILFKLLIERTRIKYLKYLILK